MSFARLDRRNAVDSRSLITDERSSRGVLVSDVVPRGLTTLLRAPLVLKTPRISFA